MKNDFQLFVDAEGDGEVDADVALLTAYLARELSPVQEVAVEKRLATDAEFSRDAEPLFAAWKAPMVSGSTVPANSADLAGMVSAEEIEVGWRAYVARRTSALRERRMARVRSAARIAAMVALVVGPLVGIAQGISYLSKRRSALIEPAVVPQAPLHPIGRDSGRASQDRGGALGLLPRDTSNGSMTIPAVTSASAQLPARLTDAEFRSLMSGISEPGALFRGPNNFTSNETGVSRIATFLMEARDTGGVYMGVGPEQNFTYIAAVKPRMAFLVDIRRQAWVQHLMYKALFEMASSRAEFMSLLMARPRPAGLDTSTSIRAMWEAYMPVAADTAAARATIGRITDRLTRMHGIPLDSTEAALLRYTYAVFVTMGPRMRNEVHDGDSTAIRLAALWSRSVVALTVIVVDSISGARVPRAIVDYAVESKAYGGALTPSDAKGERRLAPLPVGTAMRLNVVAAGYDTARVSGIRLDPARPVLTISLARNLGCTSVVAGLCERPAARGQTSGRASLVPPGTAPGFELASYDDARNLAALTSTVDAYNVPRSFLATEDAFRFVKSMHERNLIVPVTGDFGGPSAIRAIGTYVRARGSVVSAFYVSNVLSSLWPAGGAQSFFANAATLPTAPASIILDFNGTQARCVMRDWIEVGRQSATETVMLATLRSRGAPTCIRDP